MANEDLPRDPHLSALHRANGERRPRVPDEVRAAVLRAAHEAVRPAAANDDARDKDSAKPPLGGYRAQSRFAVAAVLVLAMGMGWQLIYTTAPTPDTAVTGEETVTASMDLSAPVAAEAPAEAAGAPAMAQSMDQAMGQTMAREAMAPPPPPMAAPAPVPEPAPMVANVAAPVIVAATAVPDAEPPLAAKSAPAAGASAAEAMADAAPQARAESALPTVVPVLVPPPARRYKSPQAWWAEIEALQKTDAAAAAREAAEFKRVYPRWPADPTPAAPTENR